MNIILKTFLDVLPSITALSFSVVLCDILIMIALYGGIKLVESNMLILIPEILIASGSVVYFAYKIAWTWKHMEVNREMQS
jgi:hypothetical protein